MFLRSIRFIYEVNNVEIRSSILSRIIPPVVEKWAFIVNYAGH